MSEPFRSLRESARISVLPNVRAPASKNPLSTDARDLARASRTGWYADNSSQSLASIRLRMLQPVSELAAMGLPVTRYDSRHGPGAYGTLVFSKSLTRSGFGIAVEAKRQGCRVIYDLCDNLYDSRPGPRRTRRIKRLEQFLAVADKVVFSTSALRRQILARHPQLEANSVVIPDALESPGGQPGPIGRWRLARLHRFLGRHPQALHCVWFGKSQGRIAGLDHVHAAARELEVFSQAHAVTLTVISNRWDKYARISGGWKIPHYYLSWSLATFPAALAAHDVALIPVERNGYTLGKSINRPATAIMAGLGVVGDCIESYEELKPFVMFDRWQEGLRHYTQNPPARDPLLAQARVHLADRYGSRHVALAWKDVLYGDSLGTAG